MSSSTSSSETQISNDEVPSFREIREYARDSLDVDHHDVHPIAGLIKDSEIRHKLVFMSETYDPKAHEDLPPTFWETKFARKAVMKYATDVATKAIEEGNLSQVSYMTGIPSYKSDVSGVHAINSLADWLINSDNCKLIYCAALMGKGKTDFALLLFEIIYDHFQRVEEASKEVAEDSVRDARDDVIGKYRSLAAEELEVREDDVYHDGDGVFKTHDSEDDSSVVFEEADFNSSSWKTGVSTPEFAANFTFSAPADLDVEVSEFSRFSELVEWAESGSHDDNRWFIFDEASTELTAQSGANAQNVAEVFAPFVKKMRKCGVNMIVIGHDRGDVHPAVRAIASFIDKTSLKSASVYDGIKSREPHGHVLSVSGIPETSWNYDTEDTADWEWDEAVSVDDEVTEVDGISEDEWKEWRDERIAAIYGSTDLTQAEVGTFFGVSRSRVAQVCDELNRDEMDVRKAPNNPSVSAD